MYSLPTTRPTDAQEEIRTTSDNPGNTLLITGETGLPVQCFKDWELHGLNADKKDRHWAIGRSACELAREWTLTGKIAIPEQINLLLNARTETSGISWHSAKIEHKTRLPMSNGGPRNHDLFVHGVDATGGNVVMSIESKADETFDDPLALWLAKARRRAKKTGRTSAPDRINWLCHYLLGESAFAAGGSEIKPSIAGLYYQLFSAFAGVCVEAQKHRATKAILLIHQFRTDRTDDARIANNSAHLATFLRKLSLSDEKLELGELLGPITMRVGSYSGSAFPSGFNLYVGKVTTDSRTTL